MAGDRIQARRTGGLHRLLVAGKRQAQLMLLEQGQPDLIGRVFLAMLYARRDDAEPAARFLTEARGLVTKKTTTLEQLLLAEAESVVSGD